MHRLEELEEVGFHFGRVMSLARLISEDSVLEEEGL